MADPYARVSPGQEVKFRAAVHNDMLEAAQAERDRQRSLTSGTSEVYRQASIIRIRNDSGANLLRGAVLGISAPLFLPGDDLNAFQDEIVLKVVTPVAASAGKFVILIEPAGTGAIAKAAIAGVVQVKVSLTSGHKCCDIAAGNTTNLVSMATGGSAQLLWSSGTGVQWCVIRFGNKCTP